MTVAGAVAVSAPRVNDRRVDDNGERMRFRSSILPPYARRSPAGTESLIVTVVPADGTGLVVRCTQYVALTVARYWWTSV